MASGFDREIFERVFSDAHVIDIDMSGWDKRVSFWVLADHYEIWEHRCPLVVVDFCNVHEFNCKMPELRLPETNRHLQWNIDTISVSESLPLRFDLAESCSSSSPIFSITCESVDIRRLPIEVVDAAVPGWGRPYSGFARPNLEALASSKFS